MIDFEMEASPGYFDPEDLSSREQFRRYGHDLSCLLRDPARSKRHSTPTQSPARGGNAASSLKSKQRGLLYDGHSIHSPSNAALLLENIKQEADSYDVADRFEGRAREEEEGDDEWRRLGSESIEACKVEDAMVSDATETSLRGLRFPS